MYIFILFVYWFVQAFFVWFVKKFYLTSKLIKVNYTLLCFSKMLWAILSKFYGVNPFVSNFTFHTSWKHQKSLRNHHVSRGYRLGHNRDAVSRVRLNTHLHLFGRALTARVTFCYECYNKWPLSAILQKVQHASSLVCESLNTCLLKGYLLLTWSLFVFYLITYLKTISFQLMRHLF